VRDSATARKSTVADHLIIRLLSDASGGLWKELAPPLPNARVDDDLQ
jgi:hypothetical protein